MNKVDKFPVSRDALIEGGELVVLSRNTYRMPTILLLMLLKARANGQSTNWRWLRDAYAIANPALSAKFGEALKHQKKGDTRRADAIGMEAFEKFDKARQKQLSLQTIAPSARSGTTGATDVAERWTTY